MMIEVTPVWIVALLLWAAFTVVLWRAVFRLKDERDECLRELARLREGHPAPWVEVVAAYEPKTGAGKRLKDAIEAQHGMEGY